LQKTQSVGHPGTPLCEVAHDVFKSRDTRESCSAITYLAEALCTTGVNQVAEFSGEPGFSLGVLFDDAEVCCYLGEFVKVPALKVWGRLP